MKSWTELIQIIQGKQALNKANPAKEICNYVSWAQRATYYPNLKSATNPRYSESRSGNDLWVQKVKNTVANPTALTKAQEDFVTAFNYYVGEASFATFTITYDIPAVPGQAASAEYQGQKFELVNKDQDKAYVTIDGSTLSTVNAQLVPGKGYKEVKVVVNYKLIDKFGLETVKPMTITIKPIAE